MYQRVIKIINTYSLNIRVCVCVCVCMHACTHTHKHIKQKLTDLKGVTDSNTITVQGFNSPFSIMDKLPVQKIKI